MIEKRLGLNLIHYSLTETLSLLWLDVRLRVFRSLMKIGGRAPVVTSLDRLTRERFYRQSLNVSAIYRCEENMADGW